MEILRTWFGSGLAWATPALVLLGALIPWHPERREQHWMVVALLSAPWLITWVLCWFIYNLALAFVCLFFLALAFVALGRVLRMIWTELRL